jgi:hypothetical protein
MKISDIFSAKTGSLLAFILVVLFLGSVFDVKVGPESFTEGATTTPQTKKVLSESNKKTK